MKIKGYESHIVRISRAFKGSIFADYIEADGEIGPEERKYIVELLRGKIGTRKRNKDYEEKAAKAVFEIQRIMYFWDVNASKAKKLLLNFYEDMNDETVASFWTKHRKLTKATMSFSEDGVLNITRELPREIPSSSLLPEILEFTLITASLQNKGKLANESYPLGYKKIGLKPVKF